MLSVRSLFKQISNCIRCRDDKQLAQSIWFLAGWRDGEMLGQYLLEGEKDSDLNVEGTISNSKKCCYCLLETQDFVLGLPFMFLFFR